MKRILQFEKKEAEDQLINQNFVTDFPISSTTDKKPDHISSCRKNYPYIVEWQIQEDS